MNIIETNLKFKSLIWGNNPNKIILHHAEASTCTIYDIHSWHLENGWAGCGYHYFVRKDGSIYRGRPENTLGSHCKGSNMNSLGICAEGCYTTEQMPEVQRKSIIELCIYIKNKYQIQQIYRHKDLYNTDCPGKNFPFESVKLSTLNNKYIPLKTSFISLDGGAYASYKGGNPGVNLIIKDYSENIDRVFAWVDSDKDASWAFAKIIPNEKYTILKKNTSKVITERNGGYSFTKGSVYKISVKGYNKDSKVVIENHMTLKVPLKQGRL